MYHIISIILFWLYWSMGAVTLGLLTREVWRSSDWKMQVTAALAALPFILRVFLIK